MARTQIEVNLLFCIDALPQKIIISKTENKVTVVNGLALGQAPPWGRRKEKLIPFFAFFPHCGAWSQAFSKPKTTTYGLNSFSYFSAKQWNALPDFFRTSFFADFKTKIQDVTFM